MHNIIFIKKHKNNIFFHTFIDKFLSKEKFDPVILNNIMLSKIGKFYKLKLFYFIIAYISIFINHFSNIFSLFIIIR